MVHVSIWNSAGITPNVNFFDIQVAENMID